MPLEIIEIIIILSAVAASWWRWLVKDRQHLRSSRNFLFVIGLSIGSLTAVLGAVFILRAHSISGFGTNFAEALKWTRLGLWASTLALFLVLFGHGKSRVLAIFSALLLFGFWIIPILGM